MSLFQFPQLLSESLHLLLLRISLLVNSISQNLHHIVSLVCCVYLLNLHFFEGVLGILSLRHYMIKLPKHLVFHDGIL